MRPSRPLAIVSALVPAALFIPTLLDCAESGSVGVAPAPPPDASLPFDADLGEAAPLGDATSCTATHCSADLHSVIDCNGNVVTTCGPDQGCAAGSCTLSPCESAKANKAAIGCEYYGVVPDTFAGKAGLAPQGACFAVVVANTWDAPVDINVELAGAKLDISKFARVPSGSGLSLKYAPLPNGKLPPKEVALLFLNQFGTLADNGFGFEYKCPAGIDAAVTTKDAAIHGTGLSNAFHITTSVPVVAYDVFPYGNGDYKSATLLLPTTAWDKNYVATNPTTLNLGSNPDQSVLEIVAQEDNTTVTISPTAAIGDQDAGVPPTAQGHPHDYKLDKGQYIQFTQPVDISGSPILADKPIGVWGGATAFRLDLTGQDSAKSDCCWDSAHQQILPISAMGHEYVGVAYRNRYASVNEVPPWRVVAAVDGTQLTYEPAAPPGAPTTLKAYEVAQFVAAGPFVVKSQDDAHPFYIGEYMTSLQTVDPGISYLLDGRGDPEFVNVIAPDQFLSSYVFFTDPLFPETNLVAVRVKGKSGFADVTLDCAGVLSGWKPAGSSGKYEYLLIDLVTGNFEKQGNCDNGRHEVHSDGQFGVTVWGWGSAATGAPHDPTPGIFTQQMSYAYPVGMAVKPINTVVVAPTPR